MYAFQDPFSPVISLVNESAKILKVKKDRIFLTRPMFGRPVRHRPKRGALDGAGTLAN